MSEILENPSGRPERHLRLVSTNQQSETKNADESESISQINTYDSLTAVGLLTVDTNRTVHNLLQDDLCSDTLSHLDREDRAHLILNHLLVSTHTMPDLDAIRLNPKLDKKGTLKKALAMIELMHAADKFVDAAIEEGRLVEILDPIFDELLAHDDSNIIRSVTSLESIAGTKFRQELPIIRRKLGAMFMISKQAQL